MDECDTQGTEQVGFATTRWTKGQHILVAVQKALSNSKRPANYILRCACHTSSRSG